MACCPTPTTATHPLAAALAASTLMLGSACSSEVDGDSVPESNDTSAVDGADASSVGDSGPSEGEQSGPDAGTGTGENSAYEVRGGMVAMAAAPPPPSRSWLGTPAQANMNGACPFAPQSPPCTDDACLAPRSQACADLVGQYCGEFPDDPGCSGAPPPGETWACDVEPTWPPCAVCLDPTATERDCQAAWGEHCSAAVDDPWCDNNAPRPDAVYTPSGFSLKIFSVEFSTDAQTCGDPVVVGESDNPQYVDFASEPTLITSMVALSGQYPCIIITMSDRIQWAVDEPGECTGGQTQDVYGDPATDDTIQIFISTAGSDAEFSDPFSAPGMLLQAPHVAGDDVLYSTFSVGGNTIEYRTDGEIPCEMTQPTWAFDTAYLQ